MPAPRKGEEKNSFVSRYMGSSEAKKTFPDDKQRVAVALSKWRQHKRYGKREK